ncbi:hypothetical protein DZF91_28865 [Actinomadura logoneensis]|uniref:Uncharacterized protein n=1 Tax=Actinomadura logoneensis TaxID=2293572 RepID=A0A372JEF0_9ACTN|nr:hypothetical protein [Actinomadura logoneensis]RFU38214.1 hypothetical protein DZF91_28865 [Actinomadura logoneensis]
MTELKARPEKGPGRGSGTGLRVGDVVEVLGAEEILATLDERGELDGLPFMPEMLAYCGRRMTVHKVAHKLCDTISRSGMRRMEDAFHLAGARCDGSSHGGCQTACSLYWKGAWLKRVGPGPAPEPVPAEQDEGMRKLLPLLEVNTRKDTDTDGEVLYSCQATELLRAAPERVGVKNVGQFVEDVRTGNNTVGESVRAFLIGGYNRYQDITRARLPKPLLINNGLRWALFEGALDGRTPVESLDLKPGELVRVKPRDEIIKTLNKDLLNRGMGFENEMARHCGKTARVRARVEKVIDESTGRLLTMKTPCIILEGLVCEGAYNFNCPREFVPFWREIWLERVQDAP